jgi:hypothetical protein
MSRVFAGIQSAVQAIGVQPNRAARAGTPCAEVSVMHVVLSSLHARVEEALVARGEQVLSVVPASVAAERRQQAAGRYPVHPVRSWADEGRLADLAALLATVPVDSVSSFDERTLRAAAFLRALLHLPGPTQNHVRAGTDKAVQKEVLGDAGVLVAGHRCLPSLDPAHVGRAGAELGWPLVLKPRLGFGSLAAVRIAGLDELQRLPASGAAGALQLPAALDAAGRSRDLEQGPDGIVAEHGLDVAAEYHVEVLRWRGRTIYAVPGRYPQPLLGAKLLGSVLLEPDSEIGLRLVEIAATACDALKLHSGFAHVEVLQELLPKGRDWLYVGEVGLYPGGAQIPRMLKLQHGINVDDLAADLVLGREPRVTLRPGEGMVAWTAPAAPSGRVLTMTPMQELRRLPGVVEAFTDLRPGTESRRCGSFAFGSHLFTRAATSAEAWRAARAAARAWQVTTTEHARPALTVCGRV